VAKNPGSRQYFTPRKCVKFEGYVDKEANEYVVPMEVPTAVKSLIRPTVSRSDDVHFVLTEDAWDALCSYLSILDHKMRELQEVVAKSKLAMTEIVIGVEVEDDLGAVMAEMGSGNEIPGGPYVNLRSGIGVAL
jgi:hypothetical protein